MRSSIVAAVLLLPILALSACSDDAPPVDKRAGEAKQLTAGAYVVEAKVESFTKTDKGTPQHVFKVGDMTTLKGCVGADGTPEPALLIEPGDVCKPTQSYTSGAILNIQLHCERKGKSGSVNYSVDGEFKADGFTAKVTTGTSFSTPDDYAVVRALTGKRVGNCPTAGAAPKA